MIFKKKGYEIRRVDSGKLIAVVTRTCRNLYTLTETSKGSCLLGKEDEDWLWHKRLGHIIFDNLVKTSSKKAIIDIPNIGNPSNNICASCQKGKLTITSFKAKEYYSSKPLELVHTYLCGPMRTQSINGEKYFMLCIDDYSKMTWVMFLKRKYKAFEMFKVFKNQVENQIGKRVKCLRLDRGGDFISEEFTKYCKKYDIWR